MSDPINQGSPGEILHLGRVQGTSAAMRALGEADTYLLDMDDTMAHYSPALMERSLVSALHDHVPGLDDTVAAVHAHALAGSMHIGERQKETLAETLGVDDPLGFWQSYAGYFDVELRPEDVTFDPDFLKFLHFTMRNSLDVGVLSNALPDTGARILDMLEERSGVELADRTVFLGFGEARKPNPIALDAYQEATGHIIVPSKTGYIGNSASDIRFAQRTGMVPVFLNQGDNAVELASSPRNSDVMADSVIIEGFGPLKNVLELNRPHYRRQISFSVDRPPTTNELQPDPHTICLEPSDEAVFRVTHEGAEKVLSHVPAIWQAFHERFANPASEFSIVNLPDYHHLFNEASGAVLLPDLDTGTENGARLAAYFGDGRVRDENGHISSRGPLYYRQYIEELKGDGIRQLTFAKREVEVALKMLEQVVPSDMGEQRAVLGVEDNLRGNLQALFLSAVNRWREEGATAFDPAEQDMFMAITEQLEGLYDKAVQLQYSHMLGLEYDRDALLTEIRSQLDFIDDYSDFCQIRDINPVFKTPENDNALNIAARANYLCLQYPDATTLVGVTSGGAELARVSRLLYRQLHGKDMHIINYPISVHNGLNMWSKDRDIHVNQDITDTIVGLEAVRGQEVVVCEDNSNSGQTLDRVVGRVRAQGATKVNFAVVEIDPTRVIMHHVQQKAGGKHDIGQVTEQDRPVANYFHPDFVGALGVVRILPQDNSFTKIIAIDTANRFTGAARINGQQ